MYNKSMKDIKKTVLEIINREMKGAGIGLVKVILFGSRAEGNYSEDSDWDFLVIVDKDLSFNEKWDITDRIKRKLAKMNIPNDVIIKYEESFNVMKDYAGNISYYAAQKGIEL